LEERFMKGWTGIALVAGVMAVTAPGSMMTAAAASAQTVRQKAAKATDFSAQRYYRPYYRYGYRPYDRPYYRPSPYYYARPYYYRPYPYYGPAPFTFGFGFGPFGW
jgi:hypothetical protein